MLAIGHDLGLELLHISFHKRYQWLSGCLRGCRVEILVATQLKDVPISPSPQVALDDAECEQRSASNHPTFVCYVLRDT
jgi:hypothetical protein